VSFSPALLFYRAATAALGPFARGWLEARAQRGKEDPARLEERFGHYRSTRPAGRMVWFHAASVGESGVALALIEALAAQDASLHFLLTTGTRTSATLVAQRANARTRHIYAPLDRRDAVLRFLAHWRPDLGVFVESELWPHLILEAQAAGVTLALVNARMSPKTLARWESWRDAGCRLMQAFAYVSAADARTASTLSHLRETTIPALGNLKLAAPAPRVDEAVRAALAAEIGARPVWLAASTHQGEDEIALAAHAALRAHHGEALLIIAPRHPERGEAIAARAGGAPRRSQGTAIGGAAVYVADTLGELGALYALSPAALVAGSLLPHLKGHNPIEPAKLGAAIVSGPYVESFEEVFDTLFDLGGAAKVTDSASIAATIAALWRDEEERARQVSAARAIAERGADAFTQTVAQIAALIPADKRAAHAPA
jgi:3-deoxy-D-manno-octulosonic-acid transferase